MSELPPNIDAILASIRSRMNEDGVMPPPDLPPFPTPPDMATPMMPPSPVADIGQVVMAAPPFVADDDDDDSAPVDVAPLVGASPFAAAPAAGSMTIDALVRAMLEPMLKTWLDANMPEIVEKMAQAEIKRLTGKD